MLAFLTRSSISSPAASVDTVDQATSLREGRPWSHSRAERSVQRPAVAEGAFHLQRSDNRPLCRYRHGDRRDPGFITVQRVFPIHPRSKPECGRRSITSSLLPTSWLDVSQTSDATEGKSGSKVRVRFSRQACPSSSRSRSRAPSINIPAVPYAIMLDSTIGYIPLFVQRERERRAREFDNTFVP